jgi:hypothetical protein
MHPQPACTTLDELCAVGRGLGVPDSDIWLGVHATERDVKRLSDSGQLAAYGIVHFATRTARWLENSGGSRAGFDPRTA